MYKEKDLQLVNSIELRGHPEMFLPYKMLSGATLCAAVVSDALIVVVGEVVATHLHKWWLVSSECDWLPVTDEAGIKALFSQITPFPEAGVNSMRCEVVLMAFADVLLTSSPSGTFCLKGSVDPDDPIWKVIAARRSSKRTIAFQIAKGEL
jgi:hypothetical protein